MTQSPGRRPLQTRQSRWAPKLALALVRAGLRPNQVSLLGLALALPGAAAFLLLTVAASPPVQVGLLLLAALCIQGRLLCNLLDGLMAIEGGVRTPLGELFNEIPDRLADILFLLAAGYAAGGAAGPWLGWLAAILAVLTAYLRAFGASLGLGQDYSGPMAKPHRMFVLTLGCLAAAGAPLWDGQRGHVLAFALALIAVGSALTCLRRGLRMARRLQERAA